MFNPRIDPLLSESSASSADRFALGVKLQRFAKAIAPERTQRYDSALSLALDIER